MDPAEREHRRQRAIETFYCDETSARIYRYFLGVSMAAGPAGFDLQEAIDSYRFKLDATTHEAFVKNKAKFLPLLRDALPDHSIVESRPKSVLTGEEQVDPDDQVYVHMVDSIEQVPPAFRESARKMPNGRILVRGGADLIEALGGKADPNAPPPDPNAPPKVPPKARRGEFQITAAEAADFSKYSALSAKAREAGTVVQIVD